MNKNQINKIVNLALKEDIGKQDITTNIFVPKNKISEAFIITHQKATFSGVEIIKEIFKKLDKSAKVQLFIKNGDTVKAETKIARIKGNTRALLTGERVALNFLSHLSAISTNTTTFINKVKPYKIQILDTRKTTPGLRVLEKEAVKHAKGTNHRLTLSEMVLIKDNHHLICPKLSTSDIILKARQKTKKPIGIEIENLKDFQEAWKSMPDFILLDNMTLSQIRKAVTLSKKIKVAKKPILEVSGGVNLKNVNSIAKTGINRVSIGALTHTKEAINISMEIII